MMGEENEMEGKRKEREERRFTITQNIMYDTSKVTAKEIVGKPK